MFLDEEGVCLHCVLGISWRLICLAIVFVSTFFKLSFSNILRSEYPLVTHGYNLLNECKSL